jgi:hypothetical protein
VNDLFFLADIAGSNAISGVFEELNGSLTTLTQGSTFLVGATQFQISYTGDSGTNSFAGTGNDLALQVIPEPQTLVLIGSAFMLWTLRRRRSIKA